MQYAKGWTKKNGKKQVCLFWVNLSLNDLLNHPLPKAIQLQSIEYLFDRKNCELSTLVESDKTNKPMEPHTLTM